MKKFIFGVVAMFALVAVSCGSKTEDNAAVANDTVDSTAVVCCDSTENCTCDEAVATDSIVEADSTEVAE